MTEAREEGNGGTCQARGFLIIFWGGYWPACTWISSAGRLTYNFVLFKEQCRFGQERGKLELGTQCVGGLLWPSGHLAE